MKLEIARGLFFVFALGVATAAAAAWDEPAASVIGVERGLGAAVQARVPKTQASAKPDRDFLLFMFGLYQGSRSKV